ncbi:MAG: sulfatase-like hydrolase/transferase [Tannerellaceae bacterium]|jgi:phosphoglycerol transferase MdoB-like AlkP superfamily enzyme|nr:sulfatase-like hydrolase/transferase [Tannerellaceae bacterium]
MKQRLLFCLIVFAGWLPVLAIQKPIFMIYHHALSGGYTLAEWLRVIWHGLKLDCAVAGYLTVIPLLCTILSIWLPTVWIRKCLKVYFGLVALIIAMVFSADLALYTFWGFRLDATVLFYIQFPSGAATSVPVALVIYQALLVIVYAFATAWMFNRYILSVFPGKPVKGAGVYELIALVCMGGLLFMPIRGGVTTFNASVGMVYFSNKQFLNHSAINPVFSIVASLYKQQDFASQFQFFPEQERGQLFNSLLPAMPVDNVSCETGKVELLNTKRPDILLVILESFSANAIEAVGGRAGVTPNLNSLSREGVLFTNIYANSFRTDRGLVSVLNGYLAQPTTSIMKYPAKSQTLPSLSRSLIPEGYTSEMLYGGDINYTNMQRYFYSSGYSRITSDKDFPVASRLNKSGAGDEITFDYLYHSLSGKDTSTLLFSTFLTLSSHEPFEVPYHRLEHPYLNSVAFTDSCIGRFISRIRETPVWDNLLVIFVADHGFRYPEELKEYEPSRYHIPVLWVGGAVKEPARIETVACQSDLAATLLGQLDIPHGDFLFSKDILDPRYPGWAFYTFSNGFGFVDATGVSAYDNDSNRPIFHSPAGGGEGRITKGKALLQTLYDDLGHR